MRSIWLALPLAARALQRSPLRAALTITGLLMGVAAVMMVAGVSSGARTYISRRLESMGTNVILVLPRSTVPSGLRTGSGGRLTEDDGKAMLREAASIAEVAPVAIVHTNVAYADRGHAITLFGTTASFFSVRDWKLAKGTIWTPTEELTKAKVCVLGATAARRLFGDEDPIGRTVRLGRYPYYVAGVLVPKGLTVQGQDQDDRIVVPLGSARLRFLRGTTGTVSVIFASAPSPRAATRAATQVDAILRQRHRTGQGEADFQVLSQNRLLDVQSLVFDALTAFLVLVAAVSLVVGGIGVMNIMLVSVTERTREIGIRLAVGASRGDIVAQFLAEATALAVVGGVLGVVAGAAGVALLARVLDWPMTVGPVAVVAGVGVSAVTGILFGVAPARQAARLDPIEALRHE